MVKKFLIRCSAKTGDQTYSRQYWIESLNHTNARQIARVNFRNFITDDPNSKIQTHLLDCDK